MRKILAENMQDFIRFTEETDPVDDMNIGIKDKIHEWLSKHTNLGRHHYVINEDFSINTYNTITFEEKNLSEFPSFIKFNTILGGFHGSFNKFTNFRGMMPRIITGSFIMGWCKLKELSDGPLMVNENYIVTTNEIETLEGLNDTIIKKDLHIGNNKLTDLRGIPSVIHGTLYIHRNPIKTLKYFPDLIMGDVYYTKSKIVNEESLRERCQIEGNLVTK